MLDIALIGCVFLLIPVTGQMTPQYRLAILDSHNELRSSLVETTNMIKMAYDTKLETVAQNYADATAANGEYMGHNDDRTSQYAAVGGSGYVGENYYSATPMDFSEKMCTFEWPEEWGGNGCSEMQNYLADEESSSAYAHCAGGTQGHYTQVMWAASALVGCGYHPTAGTFCNYAPGGNNGGGPYIKGTACSGCPDEYADCSSGTHSGLCTVADYDDGLMGASSSAGGSDASDSIAVVATLLLNGMDDTFTESYTNDVGTAVAEGVCFALEATDPGAEYSCSCSELVPGSEEFSSEDGSSGDDDSASSGSGSGGKCVADHSLGVCGKCTADYQCPEGGYCCPFMKRCDMGGTSCSSPIASCSGCWDLGEPGDVSCDGQCANNDFPLSWVTCDSRRKRRRMAEESDEGNWKAKIEIEGGDSATAVTEIFLGIEVTTLESAIGQALETAAMGGAKGDDDQFGIAVAEVGEEENDDGGGGSGIFIGFLTTLLVMLVAIVMVVVLGGLLLQKTSAKDTDTTGGEISKQGVDETGL